MASLASFLRSHTVADIAPLDPQNVVELQEDENLREAFETLISHHIHSAPVYSKEQGKYVGLVDLKDFVAYVLSVTGESDGQPISSVGKLVDFSHQNPFVHLESVSPVLEALKLFGSQHGRFRLHRIPILNADGKVTKMLSQSTLVEWLSLTFAGKGDALGAETQALLSRSVSQLQCGTPKVFYVKESDKLRDAFAKIVHNGINGCGVVDENNELVANLSLTDLQYGVDKHLDAFSRTVGEFLTEFHPARPLVTVKVTDSFKDVTELLVKHKLHRIYVTPEHTRRVDECGVVTLTDVIDTVLIVALSEVLSSLGTVL
jgi:CBS domain-containing protein